MIGTLGQGDLKWAGIMEECKRKFIMCVPKDSTQAAGWQLGKSCRPHAPKPGEERQKAIRTSRGEAFVYIKR